MAFALLLAGLLAGIPDGRKQHEDSLTFVCHHEFHVHVDDVPALVRLSPATASKVLLGKHVREPRVRDPAFDPPPPGRHTVPVSRP